MTPSYRIHGCAYCRIIELESMVRVLTRHGVWPATHTHVAPEADDTATQDAPTPETPETYTKTPATTFVVQIL